MLQLKPRWNVPLERCGSLYIDRPRRSSVFGYDARDTWSIRLDGVPWGRAEEWETERPPVREGRDLLLQVFPGRRQAVLTLRREGGRCLIRRAGEVLGSIGGERWGLLGRGLPVRWGDRPWAILCAAGEGYRLERRRGGPFARLQCGDGVGVSLDAERIPEGGAPLMARLMILAVALNLAADLPPA